eukprot:40283-Amphidinium_carterae.1
MQCQRSSNGSDICRMQLACSLCKRHMTLDWSAIPENERTGRQRSGWAAGVRTHRAMAQPIGFSSMAELLATGERVDIPYGMSKMVAKFSKHFGWTHGEHPDGLLVDHRVSVSQLESQALSIANGTDLASAYKRVDSKHL